MASVYGTGRAESHRAPHACGHGPAPGADRCVRIGPGLRTIPSMTIGEYVTKKLITASPGGSVKGAFPSMRSHRVRHLPVVDDDLLRALEELLQQPAE